MTPATLTAPAKTNLCLRITGVRPDGFHELDTLFLPLPEPADTLHVVAGAPGSGLALDCPGLDLPAEKNLIHKAWRAYGRATGFSPDLTVRVDKRIPDGAGLGGGSSDCAAMLRFLNDHAGDKGLSPEALNELAAGLGADVPFFLLDGPAWATGIGEKLVPARVDLSGLALVLVCPPIRVPTPWAYAEFDRKNRGKDPAGGAGACLTSLRAGTTNHAPDWPGVLVNDFESVVFPAYPDLGRLKARLLSQGAAGALMSGSGASVFALFRDGKTARDAARELGEKGWPVFVHLFHDRYHAGV